MTMNKKSPYLRFGIFLLLGILLVLLSVAFAPATQQEQTPTLTPTATKAVSELEVGSTSGIFIGASGIMLIVAVPLILYLLSARRKKEQ